MPLFIFLAAVAPALSAEPPCYHKQHAANILFENDLWGSGSDRHFTHGTRLSYAQARKLARPGQECDPEDGFHPMDTLRGLMDHSFGKWLDFETSQVSFILGQNIFTPEDTARTDLIVNDRPYAGWLYVGMGLIAKRKGGDYPVFDVFELDIGIVGPQSYAAEVQKEWHRFIGVDRPQGWDNQIKNELGILLNYERKWRLPFPKPWEQGLEMDFLPSAGVALGNVYTYASAGAMVRLGVNLPVDYGPPRIRPGAQGSDFFNFNPDKPVSWYGFAGVEGRAVARNIFLDGNTFADSHSVDKKYFVGDLHVGFVLVVKHLRFAFSNVFRTEEFNGQGELDEFGSLSLSWAW